MLFIAADKHEARIPRLHKFAQIISILDPEIQIGIVHVYDRDDKLEILWWNNVTRDENSLTGIVSAVWKLLGGKDVRNITDDDIEIEEFKMENFDESN